VTGGPNRRPAGECRSSRTDYFIVQIEAEEIVTCVDGHSWSRQWSLHARLVDDAAAHVEFALHDVLTGRGSGTLLP
jgi:hypothetical protein